MAVLASTGKVSAEPAEDFLALQVAADLTPFLFLTFRVFLVFCFGFGYFFFFYFYFHFTPISTKTNISDPISISSLP